MPALQPTKKQEKVATRRSFKYVQVLPTTELHVRREVAAVSVSKFSSRKTVQFILNGSLCTHAVPCSWQDKTLYLFNTEIFALKLGS